MTTLFERTNGADRVLEASGSCEFICRDLIEAAARRHANLCGTLATAELLQRMADDCCGVFVPPIEYWREAGRVNQAPESSPIKVWLLWLTVFRRSHHARHIAGGEKARQAENRPDRESGLGVSRSDEGANVVPRPAKGPRLYLNPRERTWLIRDGSRARRTGCDERDREGAERALSAYLSEKFKPAVRENSLVRLTCAEVLTAYAREHAPETRSAETIGYALLALGPFWGTKCLTDVHKTHCQEYARQRRESTGAFKGQKRGVGNGKIRRELGVLAAAINHWHEAHGPLDAVPKVTLPPEPPSRDRWLDRSEAAMLLAGALGFYRVFWSDVRTRKQHSAWRRYRPGVNRHLARFILIGLYTGTRRTAILDTQWMANTTGGWIDLNRGILYRKAAAQQETTKRQTPVKLGRKILAHLRRWKQIDANLRAAALAKAAATGDEAPTHLYLHVVTWMGRGLSGVRTAWDSAVDLAWLDGRVTPHALRHTRATWLMQARVDLWEAAGSLGMTIKVLEKTYGHHHPNWQSHAAEV